MGYQRSKSSKCYHTRKHCGRNSFAAFQCTGQCVLESSQGFLSMIFSLKSLLLDINWTIAKLQPDLQLFVEMNLTSLGC